VTTQNELETLIVGTKLYHYCPLNIIEKNGWGKLTDLPYSLKIVIENLLRQALKEPQILDKIQTIASGKHTPGQDITFKPARVLMQDFTGVPAIVDLAAMRDAVKDEGGDPKKINPITPVDLVIDHSVSVEHFAEANAYQQNVAIEMQRNKERYQLLNWGQQSFENFRVVPPGTGICHQVNLEYLAKVIWTETEKNELIAYPDTLVGTDSHTTMINALGVLGWGVGGIEAEAVMLGQAISMTVPEVIGLKFMGELETGVTATDLVLTVVEMLRKKGVVGKFVEFYGPGLEALSVADRATIANMAPEYGATCGFFPIDQKTIDYLKLTGRDEQTVELVKKYAQKQTLWRDNQSPEPKFQDTITLDLHSVEPSVAGPKRPQDRIALSQIKETTEQIIGKTKKEEETHPQNGDVVIAAITSCTNTSNPSVMIAAGLLAKKAVEKELHVKPWVKTSLAPGSKVVSDYLEETGLQQYLDELKFQLVGYGCTTCIGNSGPLPEEIAQTIDQKNLNVSAVLSGNRNFEGRIHPQVKANWLASPPLVVAFALAGTTKIDMQKEPIGKNHKGEEIYLKDLWPTQEEIAQCVTKISSTMFKKGYENVFTGDEQWKKIQTEATLTYPWQAESTYIRQVPFFDKQPQKKYGDIHNATILALFGDSVTTDHISPAGVIQPDSPAGQYLQQHNVPQKEFNSYGSRRGNHEIMIRGTFANIRIRNQMVDKEGGYTKHIPSGEILSIYDVAMKYQQENTPLVIFAGKEYGTGSSRDWAAKGTDQLGVRAVIAESFERIHRTNLIGMGVLPLELEPHTTIQDLCLTGSEKITITGIIDKIKPRQTVNLKIEKTEKKQTTQYDLTCRLDTQNEIQYYKHGGILKYVLKQMLKN